MKQQVTSIDLSELDSVKLDPKPSCPEFGKSKTGNPQTEEFHEYECEVYLGPCAAIQKIVRAKSLEEAIAYLKKKYPEATDVCEADHWR